MTINDPIENSLQLQFQAERLRRTIQECQNLDLLRQIALELIELNRQNTAIAQWASKRASDAENKIDSI